MLLGSAYQTIRHAIVGTRFDYSGNASGESCLFR